MVLLEHGGIIQAEAVIAAATTAHGVLLQQPQAGGGLAGVRKPHTGAGELGHQCGGGGGDATEAHGQVQGRAFSGHQSGGRPLQLQQPLACLHRIPISNQQPHHHGRIQLPKQRLHQHTAAEHTVRLGQPVGTAPAITEGGSTEVATAQVLRQPIGQLLPQGRRDQQAGRRHQIQ